MSVDNKLLLAKYLYTRASNILREGGYFDPGLAVSLLQDAVEITLLACGSTVGASPKERSSFDSLWSEIDKALTVAEKSPLQMKIQMLDLNKARVNFKHGGQVPNSRVAETCRINVGEFLSRAAKEYFDKEFSSLSLVSYVIDAYEQRLLQVALKSVETDNIKDALLACSEVFARIGERRQKLYSRGILVQYGDIDHKTRQYVNNEIVELRKQIWDVDAIVFAQTCGVLASDLLVVRQVLPRKRGDEIEFSFPLEGITVDAVRRCIEFLAQYSIGMSHQLQAPDKFLGDFSIAW